MSLIKKEETKNLTRKISVRVTVEQYRYIKKNQLDVARMFRDYIRDLMRISPTEDVGQGKTEGGENEK
jgi:hypothetical protein